MNQDTYNGQLIEDLAKIATQVMLALATDDELFDMVLRILVKPGETSALDLQELGLINIEMMARARQMFEELPRGNA